MKQSIPHLTITNLPFFLGNDNIIFRKVSGKEEAMLTHGGISNKLSLETAPKSQCYESGTTLFRRNNPPMNSQVPHDLTRAAKIMHNYHRAAMSAEHA
jgi:hypothetical protein